MIHALVDCRMADWTGVGRYTRGLVRALAARDDLRLTCVVAAGATPPGDGVARVEANAGPFTASGMLELGRIASGLGADLTHCLHFPTPLPARPPLLVTLHDLTPLIVEGTMPSAAKRLAYRALNARAVRAADRILTPSQHTASDVEMFFSAAHGKTRVTLAGADDFSGGRLGLLPACASSGPYLLSMGSTRTHKDIPTLLLAFARIADSRPELQLLLAGEGDRSYLDEALPGVSPEVLSRIEFTGRVTDEELRALYANATVFVFPSRYEGFGLPPLEAMAMGAPVVVARAASLPEVVGDAGLLFEPGDAPGLARMLDGLLSDNGRRDRLVEAGRCRAAELTWTAAAERVVAVYREVVRPRSSDR